MPDSARTPELHALLIGINYYIPSEGEGGLFGSLRGCVADIQGIRSILQGAPWNVPDDHIVQLLSTDDVDLATFPLSHHPTRDNMIAGFETVYQNAQKGDFVLIYYSGHGGRTTTRFKHIKGADALDETLVPMDINLLDRGQHLRDIELARLLFKGVDLGLHLVVVFDSCHSASVYRSAGEREDIRGGRAVDTRSRPSATPYDEPHLPDTWKRLQAFYGKDITDATHMPVAEGFIAITAANSAQSAVEKEFAGEPTRRGVLSYYLQEGLRQLGPAGGTWMQLFNYARSRVSTLVPTQTPVLTGDASQFIFRPGRLVSEEQLLVEGISADGQVAQINAGIGISRGATVAIFGADTTSLSDTDSRIALARVHESTATHALATLTSRLKPEHAIQPGLPAMLLSPGPALVRRVRLERREGLTGIDQDALLEAVRKKLAAGWAGYVKLADPEEPAQLFVTLTDDGQYTLLDEQHKPLRNFKRLAEINQELNTATGVVWALNAVSRYLNLKEWGTGQEGSPLSKALQVEVLRLVDTYDYRKREVPQPHEILETMTGPVVTFREGQVMSFRITYQSRDNAPISINALQLRSAWGIQRIPFVQYEDEQAIAPRMPHYLLAAIHRWNYEVVDQTEYFKIIATRHDTSVNHLLQPDLSGDADFRSAEYGKAAVDELATVLLEVRLEKQPGP